MHKTFIFILTMILMLSLGISARAETSEIYDYGRERLEQAVPPEAAELLEGTGITPDNNGAAGLSLSGVLQFLKNMLLENIGGPLRLLTALCGVMILCGLSASVSDGSEKLSGLFATVGVLAGAGMTVAAIADVLNDTLDLLSSASMFITTFIPLFAGVLSVMGRTATASAVNTVTLAATQLFSQLAANFLAPLCGAVMGLAITGAIHPQLDLGRLGELVKKLVIWILSLIMTVFMSILSLQTFVTSSADSVLIRTAKFAISSGVPIVGGTISDAVGTVHGSLSLIRSSIGTYGMLAAAMIVLPTLIRVICYRLSLVAAETLGEIFGVKELASLMKSCGSVMAIIQAVIVCFLLLNTIAAVILLAIGSGSA